MSSLFHPLLTLIATATDRLLAHHLEYLKEENRILRQDPLRNNARACAGPRNRPRHLLPL